MPQPTISTATVFNKANKVVKLEALPIPNVLADFHLNHFFEVLLSMFRDLWEVIGPAITSGLTTSYNSENNEWTISPGRILFDGYDITFDEPFTFTPTVAEQDFVIIRVIERQLTLETDSDIISFIPPGFLTEKSGINQYRWTAQMLRFAGEVPTYTLIQNLELKETHVKQIVLLQTNRFDLFGAEILDQIHALPGGVLIRFLKLLYDDLEEAHDAVNINVTEDLPNWADGTTNPAGTLQSTLTTIINNLTSITGNFGADKITSAARPNWADGSTNTQGTVHTSIHKIIQDLTSTTGNRGADKITVGIRSFWDDGTGNGITTVYGALEKIIQDLKSQTGGGGAAKLSIANAQSWVPGAPQPPSNLRTVINNIISDLRDHGTEKITIPELPIWADGTTNPATNLYTAIVKIIQDLTSTSSFRGAGKITTAALPNWADNTTNPATNLHNAIVKIIQDLTSTTGNRGADKITVGIRSFWDDATSNTATTVYGALEKIIQDLKSQTGGGGAAKLSIINAESWVPGAPQPPSNLRTAINNIISDLRDHGTEKITIPALPSWADSTTIPTTTLYNSLSNIINALTSTTGLRGAGKLTGPAASSTNISITANTVANQTQQIVTALQTALDSEYRSKEQISLGSLRLIHTEPTREIFCITGGAEAVVAVGQNGLIISITPSPFVATPDAGYTGSFHGICAPIDGPAATTPWVAVGVGGEIQSSVSTQSWTRRNTGGNDFFEVASSSTTYVAVGANGRIMTSTNGTSWSTRTGQFGSADLTGIVYAPAPISLFACVAVDGRVQTSPDGTTWTTRFTNSATAPIITKGRDLRYSIKHGFFGLFTSNTTYLGEYGSPDGINWNRTVPSNAIDRGIGAIGSLRYVPLDYYGVFLDLWASGALNAICIEPPYDFGGSIVSRIRGTLFNNAYIKSIAPTGPHYVESINGEIWIVGRDVAGNGVIYVSTRFRPNGVEL